MLLAHSHHNTNRLHESNITSHLQSRAGSMIVKTLFLVKIIHRIGAQNLRGKKNLLQSQARIPKILRISGNPPAEVHISLGFFGIMEAARPS
jgi:hypothetical protein